MVKTETKLFPFTGKDGKKGTYPLKYKLHFDENNELKYIVNQYGSKIEENSAIYEFYSTKY